MFFFKQKTAYEMRISDWSSDVCSSDLVAKHNYFPGWHQQSTINVLQVNKGRYDALSATNKELIAAACDRSTLYMFVKGEAAQFDAMRFHQENGEIGRASCRERVCQYV